MSIIHRVHGHAKRHYEKHYRSKYRERAHFVFLLDAVLVSAAAGLLLLGGYFRWYYHPLRDNFRLHIATESEPVGAQETAIDIVVENLGKQPLRDGRLTVFLPLNFLTEDGRTDDVRVIDLGEVAPGTPAKFVFRGFPLGPAQNDKIVAGFSAKDAQGKADERLAAAPLAWTRDLIEAEFDLPNAVVPGQNLNFRLHIKNGSSLPFADASVIPEWPQGFKLNRSTPPVYHGKIAIGALAPGQEADLEFSGRFAGAPGPLRFGADLAGYFDARPFPMAAASSQVEAVDAGLKLDAVFPDPVPAYVKPGQEVPVTIRYRDAGEKAIAHLALSVKADPSAIASVRWDDVSPIESLASGASGERTAYVRLRDPISQYATNPLLNVVPQAAFDVADSALTGVTLDGAPASVKIAGSAELRAVARYFTNEGDQIGRGPLPPKVGKSTTYWILASLQTGSSQIQNGRIVFSLPAGVAWTGRAAVTSGDDLALDGNRLTWNIGALEPHAAVAYEAPSVSFEVALTPSASQVGTTPALLEHAVFTGVDAWTGIDLSSNQGGLDTRLPGDPSVAGRASVVK